MADTLVSDAVAFPQDEGLAGISNDQERWSSAGYLAALAQFIGSGGYVHSGLTFSGHDAANDQVDLDAGRCFVVAATGTMGVDVQSTLGGLSSPAYDTTLQAAIPLLIELPTTVTNLAVQDSTTSAVWVAYDNDGTGPGSAGTVYVRTDDTGSVTAPSHPSVKIGEANPDDSTADTRANDNPTETFQKVTTEDATVDKLAYSRDNFNPTSPRQPVSDGPLRVGPHPYVSNPIFDGTEASGDLSSITGAADPFLIYDGGTYYLFYEVLASDNSIVYASGSDPLNLSYQSVLVNDVGTDYSNPHVLKDPTGQWVMVPNYGTEHFRLWTPSSFPTGWSEQEEAIASVLFDAKPFFWNGRWYVTGRNRTASEVQLWRADSDGESILGRSWSEHSASPIFSGSDPFAACGRPIPRQDDILMFYQEERALGNGVLQYIIDGLTPSSFNQVEASVSPVIRGKRISGGWDEQRMHHIDASMPYLTGQPVVAVDAQTPDGAYSIGLYTTTDRFSTAARAYHNPGTAQSVSSASATTVELTDISYDWNEDIDTANNKIAIPETGLYEITARVRLDITQGTPCQINILLKDGGDNLISFKGGEAATTELPSTELNDKLPLSGGTTVYFDVYHDAGVSTDIVKNEQSTFLSVERIR